MDQISQCSFSTKAGTLNLLQEKIKGAKIAPLVFFNVKSWKDDRKKCIQLVKEAFKDQFLIIRSSCKREDNNKTSNAGAFLSITNASLDNINDSVERVIKSYGKICLDDEVLIQPMLNNVIYSGVVFSHDPNTCSPYRVINFSKGPNTEMVTGGYGGETWQQAALSKVQPPKHLIPVIALIEELLGMFDNQPIDCEFAITNEGNKDVVLWLLQVRPLLLARESESNHEQFARLEQIHKKIEWGMGVKPFLMGKKTIYGVMPDWNPAEIIGIRPKPLALSLYRNLITDSIWAYQRHNYGYRNLRSFPLMPHFFGLPYIDLRLSFNSFIPSDLDKGLANRLVDYYTNRLLDNPVLHDKIEFEVVFSCYTLDLPERLSILDNAGFSDNDKKAIAKSLRNLTNRIVHPENGLWKSDVAKLDTLKKRREVLMSSKVDTLEKVYWLLEDAKRYGTLPFAGLARAGFIAVQMLQSVVSVGILSEKEYDVFIGSMNTVSKQLSEDRIFLDKSVFLSKYGHLRPGTYDILSPRYDENSDMYFDWSRSKTAPKSTSQPFSLTLKQMRDISKHLKIHDLQTDPVELFDFIQAGIEYRELAKFQFTKNLSDAMSLIGSYAESYGFTKEEIAYCDLSVFTELHMTSLNPKEVIHHSVSLGKARYKETLSVSLPPLITHANDIWGFKHAETEPNFITQGQITAKVVNKTNKNDLAGSIICIPNADPGFDWLFSHNIGGLITAWGGANSHMSIRAGELGLPAVIGAGELKYKLWSEAKKLHIDCSGRRVEVLN